jgi:hypothetical protein
MPVRPPQSIVDKSVVVDAELGSLDDGAVAWASVSKLGRAARKRRHA